MEETHTIEELVNGQSDERFIVSSNLTEISEELFKDALKRNKYHMSNCCKELGIISHTFYKYARKYCPDWKERKKELNRIFTKEYFLSIFEKNGYHPGKTMMELKISEYIFYNYIKAYCPNHKQKKKQYREKNKLPMVVLNTYYKKIMYIYHPSENPEELLNVNYMTPAEIRKIRSCSRQLVFYNLNKFTKYKPGQLGQSSYTRSSIRITRNAYESLYKEKV